jgi:hypothetical protein
MLFKKFRKKLFYYEYELSTSLKTCCNADSLALDLTIPSCSLSVTISFPGFSRTKVSMLNDATLGKKALLQAMAISISLSSSHKQIALAANRSSPFIDVNGVNLDTRYSQLPMKQKRVRNLSKA